MTERPIATSPAADVQEPPVEAGPTADETPGTESRPRWQRLFAPGLTWLRPVDRAALGSWLGSRVAVIVATLAGLHIVAVGPLGVRPAFLSSWSRWDATLFEVIARDGYRGWPEKNPHRYIEALFPGEPALIKALSYVVPNLTLAALIISAVAGAVACVALGRIGELEGGIELGSRAVLVLVASPFAVFLFAGYSEALFLGLALPGWLCARRGMWAEAGVFVAFASFVRVTGVFVALALLIEYVVSRRRAGQRIVHWNVLWLALPAFPVASYFTYLHSYTGDWLAWQHAQEAGWGRRLTAPWDALQATWNLATSPGTVSDFAWSYSADIVAAAVGVALVGVLLKLRRWSEAAYVAISLGALITGSHFLSISRSTLLWWPLWLLLAQATLRWRWVWHAYLAFAPALMITAVISFTNGHWVN